MQSSPPDIAKYQNLVKNPEKALYWKMTVDYGIMYIKMLNEWTAKCIAELENLKYESSDD